jgi:hypothetical protein
VEVLMAVPDRQNAIDHVVAVMFENRSFDHLLGRLYQPGEVKSFEGVIGRELGKSIPEWAEDGAEQGSASYGTAENRDTPNADPSGEFQDVNTSCSGSSIRFRTWPGVFAIAPSTIGPHFRLFSQWLALIGFGGGLGCLRGFSTSRRVV